jgi:small subunit ribosomal protein S2
MDKFPGCLVIIDVNREINALREARGLGIPTVALIDTDGDPDLVDIPIPGNDDSMRSIDVIVRELCDAVREGKAGRTEAPPPTEEEPATTPPRRRSSRAMFRGASATESETETAAPESEPAPTKAE